ncbi:MAG: FHIPEP family type III secretion protein [Polyangia bacterium]
MWNKAVRWLGRVLTAEYANTWAARLLGPKLVLAVVLVVVGLLLLPVPPLVLDALLIANLLLGVGLLGLAVQAGTPERLPQLPALLVVSIVLRLGLNVTAVRLILGQGYAGRVIAAFGSSMAGGDLVLGLAVLLVLATVQYLVLARGGERVAEVAARFILDALPGRQAAIEADLRAGVLTPSEAQAQRAELEARAQVYGAMDGALRLVKGDVVAGLLVLGLGLVGGMVVGLVEQDLPLSEAAARYALLTVGDGLATQVPALLSASAAALLLTRGVAAARLGPDAEAARRAARPVVQVEIGADVGLDPEALRGELASLSARLGVPGLSHALQLRSDGPPRWLALRVHGALSLGRALGAGEEPLLVLRQALLTSPAELLPLDAVQRLVDALSAAHPVLVREVVPRRLELVRLGALLGRLLEERLWPLDLRAVLEAVAALPQLPEDADALFEAVRGRLGRYLVHGYLRSGADGGEAGLPALLLGDLIEEVLRESLRPGDGLALELELRSDLTGAVLRHKAEHPDAVLLCSATVRRALARLLSATPQALPVIAYGELPPSLPVLPMARVEPGGPEA